MKHHPVAFSSSTTTLPTKLIRDEVELLEKRLLQLKQAIDQSFDLQCDPSPAVAHRLVREIISARRRRDEVFGHDLFADPAWDVLLNLYEAELSQRRMQISAACIAAAVPATTALRWIRILADAGLVEREADPLDGRRMWVKLTHKSRAQLNSYFEDCCRLGFPI